MKQLLKIKIGFLAAVFCTISLIEACKPKHNKVAATNEATGEQIVLPNLENFKKGDVIFTDDGRYIVDSTFTKIP